MFEVSLVTEAFNLEEGQSEAALRSSLTFMSTNVDLTRTEILAAVTNANHPAVDSIRRDFPKVLFVDCNGMGYDEAKMKVARIAQGEIIAFLDGDCRPVANNWLSKITAPIRSGTSFCSAGSTFYAGGLFAKICSIMDFGFLYEVSDGEPVGCYASNNFAIRRDHLVSHAVPESELRCNCYFHAQIMIAIGTPFRLVEAAVVEHEFPSFFKERWRRGADFVTETCVNPNLPPARSSRNLVTSAYRIYSENFKRDRQRLDKAKGMLRLTPPQRLTAWLAFPIFRLIDLVAIASALRAQEASLPLAKFGDTKA